MHTSNKRSTSFESTVRDISSGSLSRSRDTVGQKVFINCLGCITLRSTFVHAPPFGINDTADYRQGSVNSLVIVLGGIALTFSRSDVSRGVVSTLPGHHILKIGCQIPGLMSLKEVVEDDGVVCSECMRYKMDH